MLPFHFPSCSATKLLALSNNSNLANRQEPQFPNNYLLKRTQSTVVKLLTYPIRLEVDISLQVIWLKISLMLSAGSRNKTTATEDKYEETHSCERKEQCMLGDLGRKCKRWLLTERYGKSVQVLHHRFFGQVWGKIHNA